MKVQLFICALIAMMIFLCVRGSGNTKNTNAAIGGMQGTSIDVEKASIFISVPSYRDELCSLTIKSAFENAKYPGRIVIGACEQNANPSESCIDGPVKQGTVRVISIPYSKASGPCTARYKCYTLYQDEDIYLQVDSHTHFSKDWDIKSINMLNEMPFKSDECVISTYPIDTGVENWQNHDPPVITDARWDGNFLTFTASYRSKGVYRTSRQIGGGFLLCVRDVVRKVPLDPHLEGLFNNEEILYSARLFTNGIDIIAPTENIVAHVYSYQSHNVPWDESTFSWDKNTNGKHRANQLLLGQIDDAYGMGDQRTLADFWDHVTIDFKNKIVGNWEPHLV